MMSTIRHFTDLAVWQRSHVLDIGIRIVRVLPSTLSSRRSAVGRLLPYSGLYQSCSDRCYSRSGRSYLSRAGNSTIAESLSKPGGREVIYIAIAMLGFALMTTLAIYFLER